MATKNKKSKFNFKALATDLIDYRNRNGLTLSDVQKQTGIERTTLFRIELSKVRDIETLHTVCVLINKRIISYF